MGCVDEKPIGDERSDAETSASTYSQLSFADYLQHDTLDCKMTPSGTSRTPSHEHPTVKVSRTPSCERPPQSETLPGVPSSDFQPGYKYVTQPAHLVSPEIVLFLTLSEAKSTLTHRL